MKYDKCPTFIQCLENIHPRWSELFLQTFWAGMTLADKYEIVTLEENMGRMKDYKQDLQEMSDEIMTEQEVEQAMAELFKEEEALKKNILKAEKRSSFIKGFFAGWGFVVVMNLLSYFI